MRTSLFGVLAALALLAPCASSQPTGPIAPGAWENVSFGPEGPALGGALVSAMVSAPGGDVFASGNFGTIGGARANSIARWDGSEWHALGDGLTFYASDLAVGPDGSLYAADVGAVGVDGYGVMRWDGQTWTALADANGTSGDRPEAVEVGLDGTVYRGVNTYVPVSDAGYYMGRVDRWTGTGWVPTASLLPADPYASALTDLAVATDGTLYVATRSGVRKWTGTSWLVIGDGPINVLAAGANGTIYSGGYGVARWDGAAWTSLGGPSSNSVWALAVAADGTVYAGGRFTTFDGAEANHVARWDGAQWRSLQGGVGKAATGNFTTQVNDLTLSPDGTLHVGGRFDTAGGVFSPNIARWRADVWQSNGGGIVGTVLALARAADGRTVIGGAFRIAGGQVVNSAAIQSGDSWAPLGVGPFPSSYASISAIERDRNGDLIACGDGTIRWDGAAWSAADPSASFRCADLAAAADGTVYAGGTLTAPNPVAQTVRRWDGSVWTALGVPGSFTRAVAVTTDGTLYAAGSFGVSRYDASVWVSVGALNGSNSTVYDLATGSDGSLFAGGSFESVGGVRARNVARWDGRSWSALGQGTDQRVWALLVDPARGLYAGGDFTEAGGVDASRIALWTGTTWSSLAGGTDGSVRALLQDGPNGLLVGGTFARAGGTVSPYVARWSARPVAAEAPAESLTLTLTLAPNPAVRASVVTVTHSAGPVEVAVFDALGRRVATVAQGDAPAGTRTLPLDLSRLARGVYVVRLTARAETRTQRLVVVQ